MRQTVARANWLKTGGSLLPHCGGKHVPSHSWGHLAHRAVPRANWRGCRLRSTWRAPCRPLVVGPMCQAVVMPTGRSVAATLCLHCGEKHLGTHGRGQLLDCMWREPLALTLAGTVRPFVAGRSGACRPHRVGKQALSHGGGHLVEPWWGPCTLTVVGTVC